MSILQEQAVQMISDLSDDNVSFLIEVIQRLMPQKAAAKENHGISMSDSRRAFQRLSSVPEEIWRYLPDDFDPDRELREARNERYGSAG